ncbi:uncharacterized protein si:ch211-14c7.2 [Gadus morhua]|uniref:uncharacterized protein si:ch211-14c7.2 n=1 Tax=Gadus morhua TaxID=8049 RepID=UPI0011B7D9F3|nr:uncharacterized protein LOC115560831 [Gadus morhua]
MRPESSAMLQQNNNNNYPCLNMTGPTGGEGIQACPRAHGPFPSRMELSLGDLPLVRGLRAWALCSKNRLKTRGELGGGGHAPTIGPSTTSTTHERQSSCPRPADMYPAGELGGMGYGLPVGLDARQAGIGALVTVATLKTSEVGGKTQTQTQCLFLRTEKGSCLYSTTKPGGWSLGKGPGLSAGGASALVGSWLRGKVSGGGGGGGGEHQAGKRTSGPPLPPPPAALQSGGSNRVRVRSGRRWRKSCNANGPGSNKTTGIGGQRRGREEAGGTEIILGECQEGGDKGEFHNNLQGAQEAGGGGRKQEGGAGCTRSCRCCHNTLARNCARCARRAVRSGARQRLEEHKTQAGDERGMNGLGNKDGGKTNGGQEKGEQEKEREEEEKSRSKPLDSIVSLPNADSPTNCFYPESSSNSEASEKSCDKDIREVNEPLQTKMCTYSENKEQPCSQNSRNEDFGRTLRNPSGEELNNGELDTPLTDDVRPHSEYLDDSLPLPNGTSSPPLVVRNPVQKHCEDVGRNVGEIPAVADTEPTQDSKSPCDDPQEDRGNRLWSDECAAETAPCCEEGLHRLTSATPVEGSTFPAELSLDTMQGQRGSSTADGEHNNSHTESADGGSAEKGDRDHSKGRPLELCVKSDQLMPRESSPGDLYTKEPFHEEKPLKETGDVNCNEPEVVLSEEQRGSCHQATLSCRNEGKAGKDEANAADSAPGLREVDGLQGGSIPEAVRGTLMKVAEGEEDKRLGDEEDCSGVEFEEGRGEELAGEHRRAESGLESSVDGSETVPGLRGDDGSQEITGEEEKKENNKHDQSLQDGSAGTTDDEKHGNSEGKLGQGEAEYIRLQQPQRERERGDALKASGFTAEGPTLQEFATEWTQEASCAPSLSPRLLKEEEEEEGEEGEAARWSRDGGQNPVEAVVTCCPLSLIPTITNAAAGPPLPDPPYKTHAVANPAPPRPPPGAMATDPQRTGAGGKSAWTQSRVEEGSREGVRGAQQEEEEEEEEEAGEGATLSERTEEPGQEKEEQEERLKERSQEQSAIVATERREQGEEEVEEEEVKEEEEEEEDEFGGFMQADAEPGWSEGFTPSAPEACGNTENTGELTQWTSGWTDDSFHQSDDCWTAFSQDSLVASGDPVAQLWPIAAGEEQRGRPSSNKNVMDVLSEAFPSSGQLASDPGTGSGMVPTLTSETGVESGTVPTLTQLLQGERHHSRTTQDQGLLDNFHDLNKMIGQRYKRTNGVSRDLLLKTLYLEPAYTEIRNISRPTNHRLSPGLPSANRHAQSSKRRLSYDHNRNIAE